MNEGLSVLWNGSRLFVQKVMRRSQHARKETEFLRLKRTRLGLDDFESLKVIGRGAFGEVRGPTQPGELGSGVLETSVPLAPLRCVWCRKKTRATSTP